jgi:hypothetical protein
MYIYVNIYAIYRLFIYIFPYCINKLVGGERTGNYSHAIYNIYIYIYVYIHISKYMYMYVNMFTIYRLCI